MKILIEQLNYFDTFGFLVLKNLFSINEINEISNKFNDAMIDLKMNEGSGPVYNKNKLLMQEDTPFLASLIDQDRILNTAEQLIRRAVIGISVTGHYFMSDTHWHSDNYSLEYEGVKFLIYLDSLNESNGALRVMPGSHLDPLGDNLN